MKVLYLWVTKQLSTLLASWILNKSHLQKCLSLSNDPGVGEWRGVGGRTMTPSQRCPHSNLWDMWIYYLKLPKRLQMSSSFWTLRSGDYLGMPGWAKGKCKDLQGYGQGEPWYQTNRQKCANWRVLKYGGKEPRDKKCIKEGRKGKETVSFQETPGGILPG